MTFSGAFNDFFLVQVRLRQGSMLSLLLIIIELEVLSREIRSRFPEEPLYVDDLALVIETHESLNIDLSVVSQW